MYQGVASWVVYLWALMDSIWGYLFDLESGDIVFAKAADGQWVLAHMHVPQLTAKGEDIISAIMTMIHNGLVFLAQISTLLPADAIELP